MFNIDKFRADMAARLKSKGIAPKSGEAGNAGSGASSSDASGSGSQNAGSLDNSTKAFLESLTNHSISKTMQKYDLDRNNFISSDESRLIEIDFEDEDSNKVSKTDFLKSDFLKPKDVNSAQVFDYFDTDGDNFISKSELGNLTTDDIKNLEMKELKDGTTVCRIPEYDKDGKLVRESISTYNSDGKITYSEDSYSNSDGSFANTRTNYGANSEEITKEIKTLNSDGTSVVRNIFYNANGTQEIKEVQYDVKETLSREFLEKYPGFQHDFSFLDTLDAKYELASKLLGQIGTITEYSKNDPEFVAICNIVIANTSFLSDDYESPYEIPAEKLLTSDNFEWFEEIHDFLVQKRQLGTELSIINNLLVELQKPEEQEKIKESLRLFAIYPLDDKAWEMYRYNDSWPLTNSIETAVSLKETILESLGCSDYKADFDENGKATQLSIRGIIDTEGNKTGYVVEYKEDGSHIVTLTDLNTKKTLSKTTYDAHGVSVTIDDDGNEIANSTLTAAQDIKNSTAGSDFETIDKFLTSNGRNDLTEGIAQQKHVNDVFNYLSGVTNGDKTAAMALLNMMLSPTGAQKISVDSINDFCDTDSPFYCQQNLAVNALFDLRNGEYVVSRDALDALTESSKIYSDDNPEILLSENSYSVDCKGKLITAKIEYEYCDDGSIKSVTTTTFNPGAGTTSIETNTNIIKDGVVIGVETTKIKKDAKGEQIGEVKVETETREEFLINQELKEIAKKYTDREDLTLEQLQQIQAVDYLINSNDAAMQMLMDQLAGQGFIADVHEWLDGITNSQHANKGDIAAALLANIDKLNTLIDIINNDGDFEKAFEETYEAKYDRGAIELTKLYETEIQMYLEQQAQNTNIEMVLQQCYDSEASKPIIDSLSDQVWDNLHGETWLDENGNINYSQIRKMVESSPEIAQGVMNVLIAVYGEDEAQEKYVEYMSEQLFLSTMQGWAAPFWTDGGESGISNAQYIFESFYGKELGEQKYGQARNSYDNSHNGTFYISSVIYDDLTTELNDRMLEERGIDPETMMEDYLDTYKTAFGDKSVVDISDMVTDYINDQANFKNGVYGAFNALQKIGTACIIVGSVIAIIGTGGAAAPIASGFFTAGNIVGMPGILGQSTVSLIDEITRPNANPDIVAEILGNTLQYVALHYAGSGIGKLSKGARSLVSGWVKNDTLSEIAGTAAQVITSSGLGYVSRGLIADNWNFDLKGEGLDQALAIMTGIASERLKELKIQRVQQAISEPLTDKSIKILSGALSEDYGLTKAELKDALNIARGYDENVSFSDIAGLIFDVRKLDPDNFSANFADIVQGKSIAVDITGNIVSTDAPNRADTPYPLSLEDVYAKIQSQLGAITVDEIDSVVEQMKEIFPGATEGDILYTMQKLTQFSSYSSLDSIAGQLEQMGVKQFCPETGMTLNTTMNYVGLEGYQDDLISWARKHEAGDTVYGKGNFELNPEGTQTAFLLDNSGMAYLESLKATDPVKFQALINDPNMVFVTLDGWNQGVNMYNINSNLGDVTFDMLAQAQRYSELVDPSMSMQEAIDGVFSIAQEDRLFSISPDLEARTITIGNTAFSGEGITSDQIARQMMPLSPDQKTVADTIDTTVQAVLSADKYPDLSSSELAAKQESAKSLLSGYFAEQMDAYSPQRLSARLEDIHSGVQGIVGEENMDNVYYVLPVRGKSYEQIALQYSEVNGIDPSKFIQSDTAEHNSSGNFSIPNGATIVVLDDVAGTGNSMIWDGFDYGTFVANNPDSRVIFAPVVCSDQGYDQIVTAISGGDTNGGRILETPRTDTDVLLYNEGDTVKAFEKGEFWNGLTQPEQEMLRGLLGEGGYGNTDLVIVFPYMGPDNDSDISGVMTQFFVPSTGSLKVDPYETKAYYPGGPAMGYAIRKFSPAWQDRMSQIRKSWYNGVRGVEK